MNAFNETFQSWQNFYIMAGGVSATLIGLMFVALLLGVHLVNETTRENFDIFATPSIFYFVSVLLLACVMVAPALPPILFMLVVGVGGLIGLGRTMQHSWLLVRAARRYGDFNLGDWVA